MTVGTSFHGFGPMIDLSSKFPKAPTQCKEAKAFDTFLDHVAFILTVCIPFSRFTLMCLPQDWEGLYGAIDRIVL